ncbi:uncharacterized protein LOC103354017 [Stegastes partitus]|uniref:Uncharacterized protein LOC103354017 n=1 Tax=Stegastes partitus TaxID=144197 RepID=A0A9Y4MVX2_9TELE|nr:PREDICTED: uncharacterized protein LOC103354017 [Stegastes partitus]
MVLPGHIPTLRGPMRELVVDFVDMIKPVGVQSADDAGVCWQQLCLLYRPAFKLRSVQNSSPDRKQSSSGSTAKPLCQPATPATRNRILSHLPATCPFSSVRPSRRPSSAMALSTNRHLLCSPSTPWFPRRLPLVSTRLPTAVSATPTFFPSLTPLPTPLPASPLSSFGSHQIEYEDFQLGISLINWCMVENEEVVLSPQPVEAEAGATDTVDGNEGITEESDTTPLVQDLQDPGETSRDLDPLSMEVLLPDPERVNNFEFNCEFEFN